MHLVVGDMSTVCRTIKVSELYVHTCCRGLTLACLNIDCVVVNAFLLMQFERTLIVADEDSQVSYLEGCTAPSYDKNQVISFPDVL